jgi:hypothetical protein
MTPHMVTMGGIGVRVQGMRRYYAMLCDTRGVYLVRSFEGKDTVLASSDKGWVFGRTHELTLKVKGNQLTALLDGKVVAEASDPDHMFTGGAIALIAEQGRIGCDSVSVRPLD